MPVVRLCLEIGTVEMSSVKMRSHWSRGTLNPVTGVLTRMGRSGDTHTGRSPRDDGGRDGSDAATDPGCSGWRVLVSMEHGDCPSTPSAQHTGLDTEHVQEARCRQVQLDVWTVELRGDVLDTWPSSLCPHSGAQLFLEAEGEFKMAQGWLYIPRRTGDGSKEGLQAISKSRGWVSVSSGGL